MEKLIFGAIVTLSIFAFSIISQIVSSRLTKNYKSFRRGSQFVAIAKTAEEIQTGDRF